MVAFAGGGVLLEREGELETLRDKVDRACAGEGTLLLIEGPAGAGKTVLALTAAERQVCRQVAEGQTNREVAQTLFVTEKTVERHLSSAYQKLGIRSRFQLASAIGT